MEPSAPPLEDIEGEESLLTSPRFLKKVIYSMGEDFQKLYQNKLEKKRGQEIRRMQEEKAARERYKADRDSELGLLGEILKYIWLTCFILQISTLLIRLPNNFFSYLSSAFLIPFSSYLTIYLFECFYNDIIYRYVIK